MSTKLLFLIVLLIGLACEETDPSAQELQDQMTAINEEIDDLLNLNCSENTECKALPIGAKACGGPTHYVVFSSVTDEVALQALIDQYTSLNKNYNQMTNAVSDCSLVNPPTLDCVNGECTVID